MPIVAKQKVNEGYDFTVKQVEVPHPTKGGKSGYFMNVREDNDDILGWTTERYGLVQHGDAVTFADNAFAERDIEVDRKVIVTEGGAKLRAQYDLKDDLLKALSNLLERGKSSRAGKADASSDATASA